VWVVRGSIGDVVETSTDLRHHAATPVVLALAASTGTTVDGAATTPAWVDYVTALGPVILLVGALVGAVLAWSATRRDRWWARTQWAVDHVLGDDTDAQVVALAVLEVQVRHARSAEEAGVIGAVSDTLLEPLLAEATPDGAGAGATRYVVRPTRSRATALTAPDAPPTGRADTGDGDTARVVTVSAVERDAARLRAQVDTRLGHRSPQSVTDVARASPG
jgi:hypothetical protein